MNTSHPPKLALICPCFNEEAVIESSIGKLKVFFVDLMAEGVIHSDSAVILIDDGSTDYTWQIIEKLTKEDPLFHTVKLCGNVGHQNALIAGMDEAVDLCDCAITMDVDLQDDLNVIREMLKHYAEGFHLVLGVRESRKSDGLLKKGFANIYYGLLSKMGLNFVRNHADFRLHSQSLLKKFQYYPERNIYLRGLIQTMGYRSRKVFYARQKREAGETKYTIAKMTNLAWDGITSFSTVPLKLITLMGIIGILISFVLFFYLFAAYFGGSTAKGWSSLLAINVFFFSLQLIMMGVSGEYLAKIYWEVKQRPRYLIETVNAKKPNGGKS